MREADTLLNGTAVEYSKGDSSSGTHNASVQRALEKPWIPPPGVKLKSNGIAHLLAFGGYLVPIIVGQILIKNSEPDYERWPPGPENKTEKYFGELLAFTGTFVGPSLGQYYAGSYAQGNWAVAGRLGGIIIILPAVAVAASQGLCDYNCDQSGPSPLLVVAAIGGIGLFLGSTIYSFVDTHFAVRRANEKIRARYIGFSPELFPSSDGGVKPGMMAWVKF